MILGGQRRADRPTTTVTPAELNDRAADPDAVVIKDGPHWSVDVGGERFVGETAGAAVSCG